MFLKHLAVVAVFYGAHVLSSIAGVGLLSRIELGNMGFDPSRDPRKLAVTSAVILAPPVLLLYFFPHPWVLLLYPGLFWIVTKLAYLHIALPELFVLGLINVLGMGLAGSLISVILRLASG